MKRVTPSMSKARKLVLEHVEGAPWFCGLGLGRVEHGVALVMSVRRGSRRTALRRLSELPLHVEIAVREVGPIRAR